MSSKKKEDASKSRGIKEMETNERSPPEFGLAESTRENGEVYGEDSEDCDGHHVGSVDGEEGLRRG